MREHEHALTRELLVEGGDFFSQARVDDLYLVLLADDEAVLGQTLVGLAFGMALDDNEDAVGFPE